MARSARHRRWIADALAPDLLVREVQPADLLQPAPLLDAAAAVVVLDPAADAAGLVQLSALARLPAGRALTLLLDGVRGETEIEEPLAKLAPAQILTLPAPDAALRYAVERSLPSGAGRGARPNQRPAMALLGVSSAIRDVIAQIRQIAPTPIPALILGETGTGKELVARAIHEQSPRASHPFVAVNCGALPDTLLESELFGHRRGAFTGAAQDKRGLFEEAEGGTIFLDEIGDTSPALQMKLLRVLESKEVRPVGETRTRCVDVRVVSATHHDLEAAIDAGTFRQDLFYRLNAVTIYVPPLRRRRVDVPFLAQHFAEEFGARDALRITLSEDLLEKLAEHDFPGNVRELRNAVERAIALAQPGEPVTSAHLASGRPNAGDSAPHARELTGTLKEMVDRVERQAISAALDQTAGNRRRAAQLLGVTPPGLRYKMRRLGLASQDEPGAQ